MNVCGRAQRLGLCQDGMLQPVLSRDPGLGRNDADRAAVKVAVSEAGILALLTMIWGFLGSFGLLSLSLPPLDLLLLPPLAFLGRPMLEAGWCLSAYCRQRPVAPSLIGGAWWADLAVLVDALLIPGLQRTRWLTRLATLVQRWRADLETLSVFVMVLCEGRCCWQSAGQASRRWLRARLRRLILEAAPCPFSHACCAQAPAHGEYCVTQKWPSQYGRECVSWLS